MFGAFGKFVGKVTIDEPKPYRKTWRVRYAYNDEAKRKKQEGESKKGGRCLCLSTLCAPLWAILSDAFGFLVCSVSL